MRPSTALKSKREIEETRPVKYEADSRNKDLKKVSIQNQYPIQEEPEIVDFSHHYYTADPKLNDFGSSSSRNQKEKEPNDEIIQKYETVLSEINYEFKQLMKRNKELEAQIEREPAHFHNDSDAIAALQQTIEDLKIEKNHQLSIYNTEQENFNKEVSNLQYQLSVIKDKEEKYKTENANLHATIKNMEIIN